MAGPEGSVAGFHCSVCSFASLSQADVADHAAQIHAQTPAAPTPKTELLALKAEASEAPAPSAPQPPAQAMPPPFRRPPQRPLRTLRAIAPRPPAPASAQKEEPLSDDEADEADGDDGEEDDEDEERTILHDESSFGADASRAAQDHPDACRECKKAVPAIGLRRHIHVAAHLGLRLYSCTACDFANHIRKALLTHAKAVHRISDPAVAERNVSSNKDKISSALERFFAEGGEEGVGPSGAGRRGVREAVVDCAECSTAVGSGRKLRRRHVLDRHLRTPLFQCGVCRLPRPDRRSLLSHVANRHSGLGGDPGRFAVDNTLGLQADLVQWERRCFPSSAAADEVDCGDCGLPVPWKYERKLSHILRSHLKRSIYSCTACPFESNVRANVHSHLRERHEVTEEGLEEGLREDTGLREEARRLSRAYFPVGPARTKKLLRSGKGERCTKCEAVVARSSHARLVHAVTVHLKQALFSCTVCGRQSNGQTALLGHLAAEHPGQEAAGLRSNDQARAQARLLLKTLFPKPGKTGKPCLGCGVDVPDKTLHRTIHVLVAHLQRPAFSCKACGKGGNQRSNIATHLETSHGGDMSLLRPHYDVLDAARAMCKSFFPGEKVEGPGCLGCGKAVRPKLCARLAHVLTDHLRSALLACSRCPARFHQRTYFDKHAIQLHPDQKPEELLVEAKETEAEARKLIKEYFQRRSKAVETADLQCRLCGLALRADRSSRLKHVLASHVVAPRFACVSCDFQGKVNEETRLHVRTAHPEVGEEAEGFRESAAAQAEAQRRLPECFPGEATDADAQTHGPSKTCLKCAVRVLDSRRSLLRHVFAAHLRVQLFSCRICPFRCNTQTTLKSHLDTKHQGHGLASAGVDHYAEMRDEAKAMLLHCFGPSIPQSQTQDSAVEASKAPSVPCAKCGVAVEGRRSAQWAHIASAHLGRFPFLCRLCPAKSLEESEMMSHARSAHAQTPALVALVDQHSRLAPAVRKVWRELFPSSAPTDPLAQGAVTCKLCCEEVNGTRESVMRHHRKHHSQPPVCRPCSVAFRSGAELVAHHTAAHRDQPTLRPDPASAPLLSCFDSFLYNSAGRIVAAVPRVIQCLQCSRALPNTKDSRTKHTEQEHAFGGFRCLLCRVTCVSRPFGLTHLRTKHGAETAKEENLAGVRSANVQASLIARRCFGDVHPLARPDAAAFPHFDVPVGTPPPPSAPLATAPQFSQILPPSSSEPWQQPSAPTPQRRPPVAQPPPPTPTVGQRGSFDARSLIRSVLPEAPAVLPAKGTSDFRPAGKRPIQEPLRSAATQGPPPAKKVGSSESWSQDSVVELEEAESPPPMALERLDPPESPPEAPPPRSPSPVPSVSQQLISLPVVPSTIDDEEFYDDDEILS